MSNVLSLNDYRAPVQLPTEIHDAKTWLCWRLVQMPGDKKPRKMPHYATTGYARGRPDGSGEGKAEVNQGDPRDIENLVSFDRAVAAVKKGNFSGVGLAMIASNGLVALDFDDCVDREGNVHPEVRECIEGTYSELSPSGNGVRAFFRGSVRDRKPSDSERKSGRWPYQVEFFHATGYVTVTGNLTADCVMWGWGSTVLPLTDRVMRLYRERFGDGGQFAGTAAYDDTFDLLSSISPKIGLSLEKARAFVSALDEDGPYDEWLKAGQALHHEFDGSEAAFNLWREWSKKSEEKYPGDRTLELKWRSFGGQTGSPLTAAWLIKHSSVAKVAARYEAAAEQKQRIEDALTEFDLKEKVGPGIAADSRLGEMEREALAHDMLAKLKTLGLKLTLPVVRRMLTPAEVKEPTVKTKRPLTEFGMAERLLDKFGSELMYVPETEAWYMWTGVYWRRAVDVEIEHLAQQTVKGLLEEADQHGDLGEFFAFCALSQSARMVRNMVSLAAANPRVTVPATALDNVPHLLGVANGVVDLRTGQLLPPDQLQRITRVTRCNYKPGARADVWRRTVTEVFSGDEGMCSFFQRLIGYTIMGDPTEDVMVIAHGNGSNGKSTLFGAIRKVLGGYSKTADATTFLSDMKGGGNAGAAREDLMRLQGARFVYVNEPDENGELREGMVKSMTGGDAITARGLWAKSSVEFEPSWVVIMPTNHKPIVRGSDYGIWRRLLLLPFLRNFDSDPGVVKDDKRAEKLQAESEGILAWCIEGAGAYISGGLVPPANVRAAREQYRTQMDILADWIDECCEIGPECRDSVSHLWDSWQEYAKRNGALQYIRSSVALGRRMDQRFPADGKNAGQRMRKGIRVKRGDQSYADDFFGDKFQF